MDQELHNRLQVIEQKIATIQTVVTKIRRTQRNGVIARGMYWIIIILFALGAFWFIKPFLASLGEIYGIRIENTSDIGTVSGILKQLNPAIE